MTLIPSQCEKNRHVYSIGALALIILSARALAPKFQGQVEIPTTKDLITLAILPALDIMFSCIFSSSRKQKTDQPPMLHKHKKPASASRKVKPFFDRMKKNSEKAIIEHRSGNDEVYATFSETMVSYNVMRTLTLQDGADTQLGNRPSNEDTHIIYQYDQGILYGVFDGHAGTTASTIAKLHAPSLFEIHMGEQPNILKALEATIAELHTMVQVESGSTAVMCYCCFKTNFVFTATLADAEANIYRNISGKLKSIPLSPLRNWQTDEKHLPPNQIYKAEPSNPKSWRVPGLVGGVNVSRAIGDKAIDLVSQKPKVTMTQLSPGDTLVLSCDGLKDFVLEEAICKMAEQHEGSEDELARALTQASVDKQDSTDKDNVSVIVIRAQEKL